MVWIYVRSGKGSAQVNGLTFPLLSGTICRFSSFHVFELHPEEGTSLELSVLAMDGGFCNYLHIASYSMEKAAQVFHICPVAHLSQELRRQCEDILTRFEQEELRSDTPGMTVKAALYGQLALLCNDQFCIQNQNFIRTPGWAILSFITKFASQRWSIEAVATALDIPAASINRELRKITTYNFNQLLNRARINISYTLLPMKGFSIRYIANYLGFSSEKSFYRVFFNWKGMTPQRYRDTVPRQIWGYQNDNIIDTPWVIINYICEHYRQPITLQTAAKEVYINEIAINQILIQYTGKTFQEHLKQHRLRYAEALLTIGDMPICDVASEAGFNALNTFCRLFKKEYGMTASEFRTSKGGGQNE